MSRPGASSCADGWTIAVFGGVRKNKEVKNGVPCGTPFVLLRRPVLTTQPEPNRSRARPSRIASASPSMAMGIASALFPFSQPCSQHRPTMWKFQRHRCLRALSEHRVPPPGRYSLAPTAKHYRAPRFFARPNSHEKNSAQEIKSSQTPIRRVCRLSPRSAGGRRGGTRDCGAVLALLASRDQASREALGVQAHLRELFLEN